MRISTVEQMHNLDKRAIEKYGIEDKLLMENAAHSLYFVILRHFGELKGKKFVAFAGPGNNGGDAITLSRKLFSNGADVKIYLMSDPSKYKGAARMNYEIAERIGIPMERFEGRNAMIEYEVERADAIIDGILGTGISRNVEGKYAEAIDLINSLAKLVFSVDIPSGINGNTGEVMGVAVRADYTVTFGLPKIGNVLYPGFEYCGKLYVSHISFPPENYEDEEINILTNDPMPLPPRKRDGHKGTFGDVLFVAGARKYYGAPYFSALSFLKAGGGYSRLATAESVVPFIGTQGREIVFHPMPETDEGSISYIAKEEILKIARSEDFVVIGPGTSLNERTQKLMVDLIKEINKPILVDGDGLTALSKYLEVLEGKENIVLTPHPGEMARLTGISVKDILKNRIEVAREFSMEHGAILVLKGAHTLIAMPDGRVYINMTGNSGMATAGSGDVLTGTIAAMFGLGLKFEDAVRMGVFVHGLAGDIAAERIGEDGMTARDIMNALPEAVRRIREDFDRVRRKYEIEVV
ncbi:yjeF-like protein, hydroxyethylthiazole kinase-related protein [Aciduliprofundum sp. MAR08-339]|uniref:bifunctional ADP-dependent NAD(P)H-hydrate dehydratase/NAD(P)H-hydrate epimerase n=1 Tax=Aciduliprofundum sp. (strain MAR08-339) TaxID=673860 RepID=UPI0002A4AD45|nr:yjeF-like protein, hydroxyethylthiazole kinase-related protein [Aciduliprofundum sp. MAR08-339]